MKYLAGGAKGRGGRGGFIDKSTRQPISRSPIETSAGNLFHLQSADDTQYMDNAVAFEWQ